MAGCCDPLGCDAVFGPRVARHNARRLETRGLDRAAQAMVEWVARQGIHGASVLEIGGGVGGPHLALLDLGAARATNVELIGNYEAEAARLLRNRGLQNRVERRIGDVVVDPELAPVADVVVLNRVVCCYPDVVGLVSAAAEHSSRLVAFTHPPRNLVTRCLLAGQRWVGRLFGYRYQAFAHPPQQMIATLREHGFSARHLTGTGLWRVIVAERQTVG